VSPPHLALEDRNVVVVDSSSFAASVLAAHTAAIAVQANGKDMAIEMGGLTFMPGTYHSARQPDQLYPWQCINI
jgi:hypothetical protein